MLQNVILLKAGHHILYISWGGCSGFFRVMGMIWVRAHYGQSAARDRYYHSRSFFWGGDEGKRNLLLPLSAREEEKGEGPSFRVLSPFRGCRARPCNRHKDQEKYIFLMVLQFCFSWQWHQYGILSPRPFVRRTTQQQRYLGLCA